jgi:cell wall-associated NlpC family hydrolase
VASLGVVASPASADQLTSLKAEAQSVANQIQVLGTKEEALSEQYDGATLQLQQDKKKIATAGTAADLANAKEAKAKSVLKTEAINAYTDSGTAGASVGAGADTSLGNADSSLLRAEYVSSLAANQSDVEDQYHLASVEAAQAKDNLVAAQSEAQKQADAIAADKQQVQASQNKLEGVYHSESTKIADLVAQIQEQAQAAEQAAANARLAAEQQAAQAQQASQQQAAQQADATAQAAPTTTPTTVPIASPAAPDTTADPAAADPATAAPATSDPATADPASDGTTATTVPVEGLNAAGPTPATTVPATTPTTAAPTTTAAPPTASPSGGGGDAAPSPVGAAALAAAETQVGVPYVFGGASPAGSADPGFDCSGLVMWAFAQVGVSLPHYSGSQFDDGTQISMADLEPGDLVFFADPGEHVAIYAGGGDIIEAPETGQSVHIVPMYSEFVQAVRIY